MTSYDARYARCSVLMAVFSLLALMSFNVSTDPTRALFPARGQATHVANDRAVKLYALRSRRDAPELLVMGSSSSAVLPPQKLAAALGYRSGYNLALVDGTPAEALAILQRLHAQGRAPKAITYGLDPVPFGNPGGLPDDRKKRLPGQGILDHLLVSATHLTAPLPTALMDVRAIYAEPLVLLDRADGRLSYPRWEAQISSDPQRYRARVERQALAGLRTAFQAAPFEDLARLDRWLREHRIAATFFYPPLHPRFVAATSPDLHAEFRARTAAAISQPIQDLTRLPARGGVLDFYDPVHYRPGLASAVVRALEANSAGASLAIQPSRLP